MKKKIAAIVAAGGLLLGMTACSDASVASHNLSQDADNFKIERRIVFLNVRTGKYEFVVEGKCSITDAEGQLEVVCKTGDEEFKKHFLGKGPDFTYFAEQLEPRKSDVYHYKVIFKPEAIIPNIDLNTSK